MTASIVLWMFACGTPVDFVPEIPTSVPMNLAPDIPAEGDDAHPVGPLSLECGQDELPDGLDFDFCHGKANLEAPMLDVLDGVLEPRVAADFRNSTFSNIQEDPDPSATWSLQMTHTARSNLADIVYEVLWLCDPVVGTAEEPAVILCTYGMLKGQTLFPYFEGSIALIDVDGEAGDKVAWQYIEHLRAPLSGTDTITQTITDVYADLGAFLADEPYEDYEK
ncbi:MAG: hypothetical protein AAGA48_02070 [Myxococcota bacterium]